MDMCFHLSWDKCLGVGILRYTIGLCLTVQLRSHQAFPKGCTILYSYLQQSCPSSFTSSPAPGTGSPCHYRHSSRYVVQQYLIVALMYIFRINIFCCVCHPYISLIEVSIPLLMVFVFFLFCFCFCLVIELKEFCAYLDTRLLLDICLQMFIPSQWLVFLFYQQCLLKSRHKFCYNLIYSFYSLMVRAFVSYPRSLCTMQGH